MEACQIYLITPKKIDLDSFPQQLEAAIAGGPIAALLIDCDTQLDTELQKITQTLAPIAQKHDIAVLLRGDSRIAGRTKCDGMHVDGNLETIEDTIENLSDRFMLGADANNKRHDAMQLGESGIDYIMFGRLDAPEQDDINDKAFAMADWWSSLFEVPAVVVSGSSLECCTEASAASIEFIALRSAIWNHAEGPQLAIQQANALIEQAAPKED